MKVRYFLPQKMQNNLPLVAVLPGIVAEDEPTKMDSILQRMVENHGGIGVRLNYAEKTETDSQIEYAFKLWGSQFEIRDELQKARREYQIDISRIALVSNSISAIIASEYLIESNRNIGDPKIKAYASISPLLGWNYFTNPQVRERMEREGMYMRINGDTQNGKRKVVSRQIVKNFSTRDVLHDLKDYTPDGMHVMTVLGKKDKKAEPSSMRLYHYTLGGQDADLVELDAEHDVPGSIDPIVDFLARNL